MTRQQRKPERPATWIAPAIITVGALIQLVFFDGSPIWWLPAVAGVAWIVIFGVIGVNDRPRRR